jgi:hypothetical protein
VVCMAVGPAALCDCVGGGLSAGAKGEYADRGVERGFVKVLYGVVVVVVVVVMQGVR